jgi:hypothetical protein
VRAALVGTVLALLAAPAFAQTADDDWDLAEDAATGTLAAAATYATGDTLMVTCQNGSLDVFLATKAQVSTAGTTEMRFDGGPVELQSWIQTANPTVVMSGLPGPNARRLRTTRSIALTFRAGDGSTEAPQRHVLDLPATSLNVDRVLTACAQPTTDPRDALSRWEIGQFKPPASGWVRPPRPEFPSAAQHAGIESGLVSISCIVGRAGVPRDCRIEKEVEPKGAFGAAALEALRSARVLMTGDGAAVEGQFFATITRFQLQ